MELVPQPSLRDKLAHFDLMKTLTEDSDDSDDGRGRSLAARQQLDRQRCMRFFSHGHTGNDEDDAKTPAAIIKATQPGLVRRRAREADVGTADETVIPETRRVSKTTQPRPRGTPLPFALRVSADGPMAVEDSPSVGARNKSRKRRRGDGSVRLRPEGEQIFKGLRFCYIPNDDVAPVRRLRIGKAREFGAVWTRDPLTATHVVVDKDICYGDVDKMMGGGAGAGTRIVVNEEYPVDCVRFRSLLDHRQKKYWLPGQAPPGEEPAGEAGGDAGQEKVAAGAGRAVGCSSASTDSLKLKAKTSPPRRWTRRSGRVAELGTQLAGRERLGDLGDGGCGGKAIGDGDTPSVEAASTTDLDVGRRPSETEDTLGERSGTEKPRGSDELARYITMMQEFKDLPLDDEEDEGSRPAAAADEPSERQSSDDEQEARSASDEDDARQHMPKAVKNRDGGRTRRTAPPSREQFACHRAGAQEAGADNPNARTIEVLQRMADYYDGINDHWRLTSYRRAISTLKAHGVKVTSEQEALQLPHIGRRIAQKIEEIATTNALRQLDYAGAQQDEPAHRALRLFLQIYGVGTRQAQQWLARGYRTLDDVRTKAKLSPSQRIGIDHLDDLSSTIPRHEVEALAAHVARAAARVDPSLELIVGGSYRRGSATSRDVDVLVTRPGTTSPDQLHASFSELLAELTAEGFLTARLDHHGPSSVGTMFHGCCALPDSSSSSSRRPWRRIDFLLVPDSERGAGLVYFTGDDLFNRSLRLLARSKGMRLNQRGLFRGTGAAAELVEGRCERGIFAALGVRWREPRERWC
ncbi:hypothetical protein E4U42_002302 [Claviceps africana]|uniref:DNA-directed DNA polymerase n=1 Tax=Claviceps africana TaxID=83212 RepID=A0A8K0JB55_9HYPO|nr:hypothetical protein E4U42_002302 [Claviceps africana]